jgi:hypothetical protein
MWAPYEKLHPMRTWMAALLGVLFGAGDQYLGSRSSYPWLTDVSLLSAPWLALPFVIGATQKSARRAILVGCIATATALIGYFVMTLSPVEGVHLDGTAPIIALLRSERMVELGALVTAPLYGYLGYRWHERRAWLSALLLAGALCLEPLATELVGRLPEFTTVWMAEIAVGVLVSLYFVRIGVRYRRGTTHSGATYT